MMVKAQPPIARRLISWQAEYGRHDLPWQHPATPYRVWVSEIMLQQTQVGTVIPYFERFMERFPDIGTLARADQEQVLALWAGLGYYARARNLHQAARVVVRQHGGGLPRSLDALMGLPGIGRSTGGAILALAHDRPYPILDGNARRVLARYHAIPGKPDNAKALQRLWAAAEAGLPKRHAARYTQALMDLGAMVCTRRQPACPVCPLAADCKARAQGDPEAYPARKAPRPRPHRETVMLILRDAQDRVLLERRPPSGVWGGLWSLPEFGSKRNLATAVYDRLGVKLGPRRQRDTLRHGFTHYTLDIQPVSAQLQAGGVQVMDREGLSWHSLEQAIGAGLPRPVATLLQREFNTICHEPSTA